MANKSRDQSTILTAHRAHPLPLSPLSLLSLSLAIEGQKYECTATLAVHKNIYVGISGKCHTMLPRFTTAAHLLFDEFMAKLGSLGLTGWGLLTASLSMTNWRRIRLEHAKWQMVAEFNRFFNLSIHSVSPAAT